MKNAQDLQSVMPALEAIPAEEVVTPTMPTSTFIQEGENLWAWFRPDRALFVAHGQPEDRIDSFPVRVGALREAESEWTAGRYEKEEAQAECDDMVAEATALHGQTCRHFRYAFRKHPALLARVPYVKTWMTVPDRIQGLNDLAVFGREHIGLLEAAGYDPSRLDELAAKSDLLADKYAAARIERASGRGSKDLRDRAFTYLKEAVDEIRAAGRFLFWNDEARLAGYRSEYLRRNRTKTDDVDSETSADGADTAQTASSTGQESGSAAQSTAV